VPLLEVRDLRVRFRTDDGVVHAVDGVSHTLDRGKVLGIVGESGSGKSASVSTILRLTPPRRAEIEGEILFDGRNLVTLPRSELRRLRGGAISMVFQDPLSSLHPLFRVGDQVVEATRAHHAVSRAAARDRAKRLLTSVGISDAHGRLDSYPHEFSGGVRQRVMIAMAIANEPKLLIADEPTTALDVTVQAQILELLGQLRTDLDTAIILVTHDLGVVAAVADEVAVMYAGRVVERGSVHSLLAEPAHPYTVGLLRSIPRIDRSRPERLFSITGLPPSLIDRPAGCAFALRCPYVLPFHRRNEPPLEPVAAGSTHEAACWLTRDIQIQHAQSLHSPETGVTTIAQPRFAKQRRLVDDSALSTRDLCKHFSAPYARTPLRAVDGVSFDVPFGETLGIVGESGCGKSTVARLITRLIDPTSGSIVLAGRDITSLSGSALRAVRRDIQLVFQDPYSSLNPARSVGAIIGQGLHVHDLERNRAKIRIRVQELMERVGLKPEHYNRLPSGFSGGERQRIGIARALAVNPKVLIADEPVSALDVSIQSQILNLLDEIRREFGLTMVFIAHDLSVVRHVSDRIGVMYLGKLVEIGQTDDVYTRPKHPYTAALLESVPQVNPSRIGLPSSTIRGEVPSATSPPPGCNFHPRCPNFVSGHCDVDVPVLSARDARHAYACHYPLNAEVPFPSPPDAL
jgi:peptide/nickel transport system ATP-binding protein